MSRPPIHPEQTVAGIAIDPQTLERVIPESKRPDGSVRKQIKIRPGFTPQEDVRRFRGTRQAQMDANALPKGHIVGWAPPPQSNASSANGKPMSKSAKKNAKRKEKREEEKKKTVVPDSWEDEEEESGVAKVTAVSETKVEGTSSAPAQTKAESKPANPSGPSGAPPKVDELSSKLEKLAVK
ncbi:putative mago binding protein [Lyophyllum shimeji]|uniref:Mago binding protein n=1 Tax=Lyophyllum shimeji TaxID=47721 RepID=A0A9P3PDY9_LYOSH|nr:putative mago binding protein [Lyophyllum shimeji]